MSGSLMASAAPVKETPVGGETWLIASSASGMEMMTGLLVVAAAGMARTLLRRRAAVEARTAVYFIFEWFVGCFVVGCKFDNETDSCK